MPYADNSGVRIYYEVAGEGDPMVLIHANPFDHRLWLYQLARFSERYRTIAVDMRGYGRSDKPTSVFSLRHMADDVVAVCEQGAGRASGVLRRQHRLGNLNAHRARMARTRSRTDPRRRL